MCKKINKYLIGVILVLFSTELNAQDQESYVKSIQQYEPSEEFPFGRPNPKAPKELQQFKFMIGICDCQDSIRQASGEWISFPTVWSAKYFLNGYGIQDNYFNPQNPTSNIRIFDDKSKTWKVTYFQFANGYFAGEWEGKKEG